MDHLESMRIFVRVADLGSFVRAAQALDVSGAVVTRHVAGLEGRLGARLLNRTTRSLSLTEAGQLYLERARQVLGELEDVEQMVLSRNHQPIGTLRIVAPVEFGMHNLGSVLQTYTERYPKVTPDVTLVDRPIDLVEEGFDVGVLVSSQVRAGSIVARRFTTTYLIACAAPAYLAKHGVPRQPEQLHDHAWLGQSSESWAAAQTFMGSDGNVRVSPTGAVVANNTEMLRRCALLGMGIAILPAYLVDEDLASGRLVRLLDDYTLPHIEYSVAYPSRRHLPAKVRTFVDHVIARFGAMQADVPRVVDDVLDDAHEDALV